MKNYLIGGLVCLVAALMFGFEPVHRIVNEATNRGTLRGVERCIDLAKSELLSQEAIRSACIESFHQRLNLPELASGEAGPGLDQGVVQWEGRLENKTSDHVVSSVLIAVIVFDSDGKQSEFLARTPIWIEPMGEAEFKVELPTLDPKQVSSLKFCDDDAVAPKACMTWELADVMGLTI